MLSRGKHGDHTVIKEEMHVDTFSTYIKSNFNVCFIRIFFSLVCTEEFNFPELLWSQHQSIFFESSQIGEYLFHLTYKNRGILFYWSIRVSNHNALISFSLSETEEENSSSDNEIQKELNNNRRMHSTSNIPPVIERPCFRKYGVNDFRYLKVS